MNESDDQAFLVAKFEDEESVFYVEIGIVGISDCLSLPFVRLKPLFEQHNFQISPKEKKVRKK